MQSEVLGGLTFRVIFDTHLRHTQTHQPTSLQLIAVMITHVIRLENEGHGHPMAHRQSLR